MIRRLHALFNKLKQQNIPALLISRGTNIRYLTNYSGDEAYLLVLARGEALFITDFRNLEQAEKESHGLPLKFARCRVQTPPEQLVRDYCMRFGCEAVAVEKNFITYHNYQKLVEKLADIPVIPTDDLICDLRQIKDENEIKALQQAASFADQAFEQLLAKIAVGMTEREVAAELEYRMVQLGAEEPSFKTIVASGKNGSQCHARPSEKKLAPGDFVTIDFGAKYQGYCSDCTRTIVLGSATERQKEIYRLVLDTKNTVQKQARAGSFCKILHLEAERLLKEAGYGPYFGHGLGHGIGLDVHEEPSLNQNSHAILKAGHAITIEPGIYLPNWGGVRIEDSLVIDSKNATILSKLPTELICI
ncbi:MAG: M24 family metallopeptidase [Bacillota bacterium]|jgi:Xaa-Pro aminopeptidase